MPEGIGCDGGVCDRRGNLLRHDAVFSGLNRAFIRDMSFLVVDGPIKQPMGKMSTLVYTNITHLSYPVLKYEI